MQSLPSGGTVSGMPKNGKIWRKHSPCKKFPSKNFTRDFLEGSAGIVPPFGIFGREWMVYKKW